jgi:glycosyltransferase involved in cell wall biosynthesis
MNCTRILFRPIRTGGLGLYYTTNAFGIFKALSKLMKTERIDIIVHANIIPSYIALKIATMHGIPSIYDYHDHFPDSAASYYTNYCLSRIARTSALGIVRRNIEMSNYLVSVGYAFQSYIQGMVKSKRDKIAVIPNGLDADLFRPAAQDQARELIGLEGYRYVLLYYGSMDVWVDFDVLLRLVGKLRKNHRNILLMLVGLSHNPSAKARLVALIRECKLEKNVIFFPPQPYERMPLFVNASDAVIIPYKKCFKNYVVPLKIVESLACAKPVITSLIEEFKLWFGEMPIIYYDDKETLEAKVTGLMRSYDALRPDLIAASRDIRRRFSWKTLASEYDQTLRALC